MKLVCDSLIRDCLFCLSIRLTELLQNPDRNKITIIYNPCIMRKKPQQTSPLKEAIYKILQEMRKYGLTVKMK